ncbi:MAG: hypothetical protein Q4C09_00865 [Atopobiaceae bacterium]|nr:hypothetical protein [Atopobiaceae bacterium]
MHRGPVSRLFVLLVAALTTVALLPLHAFADETINMVEGDVRTGFVEAGTACESSDPAVAWVDGAGSLNALKEGSATIMAGDTTYTVDVADYTDGTPVVGKLKILARYNSNMQFYDGHVYLLFTSYQDGLTISVPDLYAAYEISDQYYTDIADSISYGSNHTGSDVDQYFTFNDELTSMTLNRGQIVTIGQYRDFDLTIAQTALQSVQNSSMWTKLVAAGKSDVVYDIFRILETKEISTEDAFVRLEAVLNEMGTDYTALADGTTAGGLCFNRELYNQKLEWDQYENVTYELDITYKQFKTLEAYLGGNLNKFSLFKNSCATVAVRAWNGAIGTREGADTAYKLSCVGEGIYSMFDAPKTVRESIESRLPGYYLNNSDGVAEPDAGFADDTGEVYVSAPEPVDPVEFVFADESLVVDENASDMAALINVAKGDAQLFYASASQQIPVTIGTASEGNATTISSVGFNVNGTTVALTADSELPDGIWFKKTVDNPQDGKSYYITDGDGNALASEYADGAICFHAASLPVTFELIGSDEGTRNRLDVALAGVDEAKANVQVYYKSGDEATAIEGSAELTSGTKVYVKAQNSEEDLEHVLSGMTLNGTSLLTPEAYDEGEGAYVAVMPKSYAKLEVRYEAAEVTAKANNIVQVGVGDVLNVADYATLTIGGKASDALAWSIMSQPEGGDVIALEAGSTQIKATAVGNAVVWANAAGNANIGVPFNIQVVQSTADMARISFDDETAASTRIEATAEGADTSVLVPHSGYLVPKGSSLTIAPATDKGKVISEVRVNDAPVAAGSALVANEDTTIKVSYRNAKISGMPSTLKMAKQGDTHQINAKVKYDGLIWSLLPVYDQSIRYESSDSLLSVDENGLITVAGEVPEGGKAVIITAYAGSSADTVTGRCKVAVGNYDGAKIVGNLTISARTINGNELVAHGALTFTTYDDLDLDVSYYHFYKPTAAYTQLMYDYEDSPQDFTSDPALYSENELDIDDRESYFETLANGANSPAAKVSLRTGESISMSNYGYESAIEHILKSIENGTISSSKSAQALVQQVRSYFAGQEIDAPLTFDALAATVVEMYKYTQATGHNPVDGVSDGGLDINREIYNQFRRNDSHLPNCYYTVDITADELAAMEAFVSNPKNNQYELVTKNCATGVVDIWNAALTDRPELQLTASITGVAVDPQSLYFELAAMQFKQGLDGKGGTDFYPRTLPSRHTWTFTATGNTLTATCTKDAINHYLGECDYLKDGLTLTLTADACSLDHVKVEGLDEFNAVSDDDLVIDESNVAFYRSDTKDAIEGGEKVVMGTTEPGNYYATLTCGDQSAAYAFVINDSIEMHRLYNPNSGEHFYTASVLERDGLVEVGWNYEGVGWYAPLEGLPVYRLYNKNGGDHHYTMSIEERDMLIAAGWNDEGIGWQSDLAQAVPLLREYNPNAFSCNHNYTTSKEEHDYLVSLGWKDEGIGWYGVAA